MLIKAGEMKLLPKTSPKAEKPSILPTNLKFYLLINTEQLEYYLPLKLSLLEML